MTTPSVMRAVSADPEKQVFTLPRWKQWKSAKMTILSVREAVSPDRGAPALSLITPRAGSHIVESERDGRLRMNLSWRYHGPLASLPEYWLMELVNPTTSEIVRSENLTCFEASDTPASETHPLPSRTCQASYVDDTLSGSYRLRLSGAGLTAQSAGIIHWGVDVDRPFIGPVHRPPRLYPGGSDTGQFPVSPGPQRYRH